MELPYVSVWSGSDNPKIKRGKASFSVGPKKYELSLSSFAGFLMIGKMLREAYVMGKEHKTKEIQDRLRQALNLDDIL